MFTGNESEIISLQTATEWTANFRDANPDKTQAHFFGINKINQILSQAGCVGIRIYYSLDDKGDPQLIMVGAKSDESDQYTGVILERSYPCPPFCGGGSPLNG